MRIIVGGVSDLTRAMFSHSIKTARVTYFDNHVNQHTSLKIKMQRRFCKYIKKMHILSDKQYKGFQKYNMLRELFDIDSLKKNEVILFVLMERNWLFSDLDSISYLRKHFPNSKFVAFFTNSIGSVVPCNEKNQKLVLNNKEAYDLIYTFNPNDAKKYNLELFSGGLFPYDKTDVKIQKEYQSDILWIGKNKGRFDLLYQISSKLKQNGIKTKFIITSEPDKRIANNNVEVIQNQMPYSEYIKYLQNTKCLLDLDYEGCGTIRLTEAIAYNKIYLTNNKEINNRKIFCDTNQLILFNNVEDLDSLDFTKYGTNFVDSNSVSSLQFIYEIKDKLGLQVEDHHARNICNHT